MEARRCTNCGRPLTEDEMRFGVTKCGACAGSAGWTPATSTEGTPQPDEPPLGGEERDVVGAGRYILNFVLAGFIGLGLSYLLRFRGWLATWISLGVFIVAVVVIVVVAVVAATEDRREAEAFAEEMIDITRDLDAGYALPITRAGLSLETDCTSVDPDPAIQECDEFVDVLADASPSLATGIERMKSLRRDIPGDAPEEIDELMADLIRLLDLKYESALVLIEGWNDLDAAKWQRGWDLSLQAAMEGLDFREASLRITDELDE